jgi:hypothetical protein
MKIRIEHLLRSGVTALVLSAALAPFPACASKVMEMGAEDMLRAAGHVKETLGLTPNQQTLWQQVSSRSGALLRARQWRRDKLQADLKARLADPRLELRELAGGIEAEAAASASEERELRELWLTVGDALTDQQRQLVSQFMLSQLERVDAPERAGGPGPERRDQAPRAGRRHQKQDGMGSQQRF